jgi:hypothetical protein
VLDDSNKIATATIPFIRKSLRRVVVEKTGQTVLHSRPDVDIAILLSLALFAATVFLAMLFLGPKLLERIKGDGSNPVRHGECVSS